LSNLKCCVVIIIIADQSTSPPGIITICLSLQGGLHQERFVAEVGRPISKALFFVSAIFFLFAKRIF
jgi:hypothetical protein